jgi:hypothetical protein
MDRLRRQTVSKPVPKIDDGYVRQHHAQRCSCDDAVELVKARSQGDSDDLSLVTHLGEKERECRCPEDTRRMFRRDRIGIVQLVGDENPDRHDREGSDDSPIQDAWTQNARGCPMSKRWSTPAYSSAGRVTWTVSSRA